MPRTPSRLLPIAASLFAGAACGGSDSGAAHVDATVDGLDTSADATSADAPDATPAAVVHVLASDADGKPVAHARLVVHDAAGAVAATAETDAQGAATVSVPAGGALTSFGAGPSQPQGFTFMGLADGDTVRVPAGVLQRPLALLDVDRHHDATLPGPFAGAAAYRIQTGCGEEDATPGTPTSVGYASACQGADRLDFAGWALAADGSPLAFSQAVDVDPAGGAAALSAWQPLAALDVATLSVTGAPTGADVVGLAFAPSRHGHPFRVPAGAVIAPHFGPQGNLAAATRAPAGFADALDCTLRVDLPPLDATAARRVRYERHDPTRAPADALALDEAATALPRDVAWEHAAGVAAGVVSWTMPPDATASEADAVRVQIRWRDDAQGQPTLGAWTWLVPVDHEGRLTLPSVPTDLAAALPSAAATTLDVTVTALASAHADDFHALAAELGLAPEAPADRAVLEATLTRTVAP